MRDVTSISLWVLPGEPECVRLAAQDLAGDLERVTGRRPPVVSTLGECSEGCLVVGTVGNPEQERLFPEDSDLLGQWEAGRVEARNVTIGPIRSVLVVLGSDVRGTMFALYALAERFLGVDPLGYWSDREPEPVAGLDWTGWSMELSPPSVKYRGWFINDEDLLSGWKDGGGVREIDYPFYRQVTAPEVTDRIIETVLRLRLNLLIPASFTDLANPAEAYAVEAAARRGLFVSQHHIEPLGVSAFAFQNYWRGRGREVAFSYYQHPEAFEEVWRHHASLWGRFPNVIWQLGLRGIADRPVWESDASVPADMPGRGRLISDAMRLQWEIVRSVDRSPEPLATTTLWMEGAELNRSGYLQFPPGVMVVFSDNSPGWKWQEDFYLAARQVGRRYGFYYHHALWDWGPHWVPAASPERTHRLFSEALAKGDDAYAILNVANIREFVLPLAASARMLNRFPEFDPESFLIEWCRSHFGDTAELVAEAFQRFFEAYGEGAGTDTPNLIDGQVRREGEACLRTWLEGAPTSRWAPAPDEVRSQLARLELAASGIDRILSQLNPVQLHQFETHFLAPYHLLRGLLRWLDAAMRGDAGLLRAGWAEIEQGQAFVARGKWRDWYRGDLKMDLETARSLTEQFLTRKALDSAQDRPGIAAHA